MKNICTIKPGDTLLLECTVTEDDGTTRSFVITNFEAAGQVA